MLGAKRLRDRRTLASHVLPSILEPADSPSALVAAPGMLDCNSLALVLHAFATWPREHGESGESGILNLRDDRFGEHALLGVLGMGPSALLRTLGLGLCLEKGSPFLT